MAATLRNMPPLDRALVIRDLDNVMNEKAIEIASRPQYAQL
jgi:hypothetical protein